VYTRKRVANRGDEGQNWKFRADVTGGVACPINLGIAEPKSVSQKIPRDCRDVILPPTPVINVRLINQDEPRGYRENAECDYYRRHLVGTARCAVRTSQRDVPTR
jgi:hypothetical protein